MNSKWVRYRRVTPRGWIVSSRKMPVDLFIHDERFKQAVKGVHHMTTGWWLVNKDGAEWFESMEAIAEKYPDIALYAHAGKAINIYLPNHVYQWVRKNAKAAGSVSSFITASLEKVMKGESNAS